jgi:hypothetical protein
MKPNDYINTDKKLKGFLISRDSIGNSVEFYAAERDGEYFKESNWHELYSRITSSDRRLK